MFSNSTVLGISWWSIFIVIGVGLCLFAFDKLCSLRKVSSSANKFYYLLGIVAIVVGFLSASLVQSFYNYIANPQDGWQWGGVTFMGGMYGGVLAFVIGALIFAKGSVRRQFGQVCEIGLTCIPIAHAFGRIGCFSVGCCYGAKVQPDDVFGFLGVVFKHGDGAGVLRYPTQLFEAVFLFILAAVMITLVVKNKKVNTVVYFGSYGVFRFLLEFLRDDARGSIGSATLSPSQVLSIVSVIIALIFFVLIILNKYKPQVTAKISHFFKLDVADAVVVSNAENGESKEDVSAESTENEKVNIAEQNENSKPE